MTRDQLKYADGLIIVVGIWLIIAAFALGFTSVTMALWNSIIVGVALIVIAGLRISNERGFWLSWVMLLLGLWLIISPFVLGFGGLTRPMLSTLIAGIAVVLLSAFSGITYRISGYPPASA